MRPKRHLLLLSCALAAGLLALAADDARAAVCGNGTCEAPETAASCAEDCHWACGDAVCSFGEDHGNCAVDCPDATCGNGTCEVPENATTCFGDCHYACGDGLCGCGETNANCPGDCPDASCGSGFCEAPENATTCADDCAFACGNGTCDLSENFGNCEVDCPPSCGNANCEAWEDATSCPADCIDNCGDGFCSNSAALGFENGSNCPADCPSPSCGNGFCTGGEVYQTCSVDCPGAQCGDSVCGAGEDCYSCEFDCGVCAQLCGDGLLQAPEECDDGDTDSNDGCSDICIIEECGDGTTQSGIGEQCDDSNTVPDDGCTALCKTEYCGDIYTQPGIGEVCDGSSKLCTTASGYQGTQACTSDCTGFEATCTTRLSCGDGICSFPPESGDPADAGYCPQDCAPQVAECVTLNGQPQCQSACGDGVVTGTETCDDGNTDSLDGCSAECQADTVPALPLVDLGTINGGDFDGNGQLEGADIQAALDTSCGAGCILLLPAVTYEDVEVEFPASITNGVVIRGQGMDQTVLKAPVPQVDHMFEVVYTNAFTVIQQMTWDGQKQLQPTFDYNYSPSGLRAGWNTGGPSDVGPGRVEHVKLKDHVRQGVVIRRAANWIFNHNIAHDIGCADDAPCPMIDLPYLPQNVYPQLKSTGWGIVYHQPFASGAWAHHNTMWSIKKIGIESSDVIYDYRFNNNFIISSRGALVTNSGGGLRGLVDHNYVERTQDEAIQTRTGDTTIHNNVLIDNYGIGVVANSKDPHITITDNVIEHDCKRWGTNSFSISREGPTGDGAIIAGNDIQLADNCSNPIFLRRDNMLVENNRFAGGRPDQWVMIMDTMCNAEVKHTTLTGTPSQVGFHVNRGVENLEATVNFNAIDATTNYTIDGRVKILEDNVNVEMNDGYDEGTDGDLSGDHLAPTFFNLVPGSNLVTASQQGDAFGRDVDYLTVTVPAGMVLSSIRVESYSGSPASPAFLGLQGGSSFSVDAETAQNSDLLGGASYSGVAPNILPDMGTLPGATGFLPPLFAGDYTFWLNQTGDPSSATLDFVLTAQPTGPEIEVWGMGQPVQDGATGTAEGNGTYFGDPGVGAGGVVHSFTVRNIGTLPLDVSSVDVTGLDAADFTLGNVTTGALAASGGTTSFDVTFDPGVSGERTAALEIANDDSDEAPFDFAMTGGPRPTPVPAPARGLGALVLATVILGVGFAVSRRA